MYSELTAAYKIDCLLSHWDNHCCPGSSVTTRTNISRVFKCGFILLRRIFLS